ASRYGNGRINKPLTKLSTAVVAPIASAMVRTAIAVNAGCFSSWRRVNRMSLNIKVVVSPSLLAQGLDRIDACRAPGGEKTGSQRGDRDHDERQPKRDRVARTHLIKHVAHQTREHDRRENADGDACSSQDQSAGHYQANEIFCACAESHAQTKLTRPLGNGVRHNRVKADRARNSAIPPKSATSVTA